MSRTFSEGWQGEQTPKPFQFSHSGLILVDTRAPLHLNRPIQVVFNSPPVERSFSCFSYFGL